MSLKKTFKAKVTQKEQIELLKPISRSYFLSNKQFLFQLHNASTFKSKEILLTANESEIVTLLLILFFICKKQIPLTLNAQEKLKKNKKIRKLDSLFPNCEYLKSMLFTTRDKQIELIKPFINHLQNFVTALFILPK